MSLDQFVACRRAPKLPDDLPQAGDWRISQFEGEQIYTFKGKDWLINLMIEPEFPEELREQLVDDLEDAGIEDAKPADYGVLVSVSLEPVRAGEEAIDRLEEILDMLVETCDGVVMAN